MQTTKVCSECGAEKPLSEFYKESRNGGKRRRAACAACYNAHAMAAFHRDREAWNKRTRDNKFKRLFGITAEQRAQLLESQIGRCAGCRCLENESRGGRLCVDHLHAEEIVRGLLCHRCNTALGLIKENPQTLRALADYVEHHAATLAALVAGEDQPPISEADTPMSG